MSQVLLLNSDWAPLQFINEIRALKLLIKERAEIISISETPSMWNQYYNTVSTSYQVPATIRLYNRVNIKYSIFRFRKRTLFNRDNWSCQYCSKQLNQESITIDHIVPRCRGGTTTWKNCVVCCKTCNRNKGSYLPIEVNMKLIKQPDNPKFVHFWNIKDKHKWHQDWVSFIII